MLGGYDLEGEGLNYHEVSDREREMKNIWSLSATFNFSAGLTCNANNKQDGICVFFFRPKKDGKYILKNAIV